MSELGDYLKKLRGNVSLREASKRSGISHSYINSLESGTHPRTGAPINPTPDILRGLAKAYNHSYDDLMKLAGYSDETQFKIAEEKNKTNFIIDGLVKKYDLDLTIEGEREKLEQFIKLYADLRKS